MTSNFIGNLFSQFDVIINTKDDAIAILIFAASKKEND